MDNTHGNYCGFIQYYVILSKYSNRAAQNLKAVKVQALAS